MSTCLSSHRLIIAIVLIGMVLLSTVCDAQVRERRKYRRINCAVYVFAPRCRGVSAKRSYQPVSKEFPDVYQLSDSSNQDETDALSLNLPSTNARQSARQITSNLQQKLEHLERLQRQQQQHTSLIQVLRMLSRETSDHLASDISNSQWRPSLSQENSAKGREASMNSLSNVLFPYESAEDSQL